MKLRVWQPLLIMWAMTWAAAVLAESATGALSKTPAVVELDVYKSPTCGCCAAWVDHIEVNGFKANTHTVDDLGAIKNQYAIKPEYQSCHTAISKSGYLFEGHVPARVIVKFLDNPPDNAIGLAVAGMPVGSPGMEMGDQFEAYDVLLLKKDGSSQVYEHIDKKE